MLTFCHHVWVAAAMTIGALGLSNETVVESFEGESIPPNIRQNNVAASLTQTEKGKALDVAFSKASWPNVFFTPPSGDAWDWSAYRGIAVDVFNPEAEVVQVCLRVDNTGADGMEHCVTANVTAQPGQWTMLWAFFKRSDAGGLWGMRGVPVLGPLGSGRDIDPAKVVAFQVFLPTPDKPHRLLLDNVRVFGGGGEGATLVPFPFVNRFGQYIHADWPGKLKDEAELATRRDAEEKALAAKAALPGRDRFGGWAEGPQLDGTGWFRTQEVDGRWWLVTPEGRLFFSTGTDCVGTGEQTFVEKREAWFEWLPDAEGPFQALYSEVSGAHSMAEPIDGKGRTFSFYRANLIRKYGEQWPELWRANAYARLQAWGFNTIANWSQEDVLQNSPMPFVVSSGVWGQFKRIEGGGGYWNKMPDAFDPQWAEAARKSVGRTAERYAANPLCIGYFVDNELAWEQIERGTLASPPEQPCRVAFIERLKEQYGTLDQLAKAWEVSAESWDALRAPEKPNAACQADLDTFVHAFGVRYFETIKNVLRERAPHHLYLGCRFSSQPKPAVRAAADVVDVVSFNIYRTGVQMEDWTGDNDLGKPCIIGEFHFGALDRGMFHTGLVGTAGQADRAAHYQRYVESVADCPAFVGCHWFQYIDEPITGRWFDGENYNIGFVDVTDTPYPELVAAATETHSALYARRHGSVTK